MAISRTNATLTTILFWLFVCIPSLSYAGFFIITVLEDRLIDSTINFLIS